MNPPRFSPKSDGDSIEEVVRPLQKAVEDYRKLELMLEADPKALEALTPQQLANLNVMRALFRDWSPES